MNDQLADFNPNAPEPLLQSYCKKVLLIDSNPVVSKQIGGLVSKLRHNFLGSTCCLESIEKQIDLKNPDYIIINVATNGTLDGYQIAKILKLDYEIPFALITGATDAEEKKWADELNPDSVILYSNNEDHLRMQLQSALI